MNLKKLMKVKDDSSVYYALLKGNFVKYIVRVDGRTNNRDSDFQFDNGKSLRVGEDYKYYEGTPVYVSQKKNGVWGDWEKANKEAYKKIFLFYRDFCKEIFRVHGDFSDFDEITTDINYLLQQY